MSEENSGAPVSEEQSSPESSANEVLESIDGGAQETSESTETLQAEDATDAELEEVLDSEDATEEEVIEAKQELVKRLKLKVNGREIEEEIDFNDEDRLRELLQKGYAADEKFQKASGLEKRMQEFAQLIQKDPLKALEAAGHNMDELSEQYMQQRIADMQKTPEQKRLEELEKQIEAEKERNETLENERKQAEQARAEEEYSRQLDDEITVALQDSTLPKSPYVVKRIAETLMIALNQADNDDEVSVSDIMPLVERQIKGEIQDMFEAMPEELIEKVLGTNVSKKLRNRRINSQKKTVTKAADVKSTGKSESKRAAAEKEAAKVKASEFFKNF